MQEPTSFIDLLKEKAQSESSRGESPDATPYQATPGDVWAVVTLPADSLTGYRFPSWSLLILESDECADTVSGVPVFRGKEFARPEDRVLPTVSTGPELVVSIQQRLELFRSSLSFCQVRLPIQPDSQWLQNLSPPRPNPLPLMGPEDVRIHFHEHIRNTSSAQTSSSPLIEFPLPSNADPLGEYVLAASSPETEIPLPRLVFQIVGKPLELWINLSTDRKYVDLLVVDRAGNPSRELDGAKVSDGSEATVEIQEGRARLAAQGPKMQMQVHQPDGAAIDVVKTGMEI